eukprot:394408-Pyramimonas_sp.AAC.1
MFNTCCRHLEIVWQHASSQLIVLHNPAVSHRPATSAASSPSAWRRAAEGRRAARSSGAGA